VHIVVCVHWHLSRVNKFAVASCTLEASRRAINHLLFHSTYTVWVHTSSRSMGTPDRIVTESSNLLSTRHLIGTQFGLMLTASALALTSSIVLFSAVALCVSGSYSLSSLLLLIHELCLLLHLCQYLLLLLNVVIMAPSVSIDSAASIATLSIASTRSSIPRLRLVAFGVGLWLLCRLLWLLCISTHRL